MRMFLATVETIDRGGQQIRRAAFDRTGVTEYGAFEIRPGQFICVAQGITTAPTGTIDLGVTVGALLGSLPTARRNQIATRLGITRAEFEALTVGQLLLLFGEGTWKPNLANKVQIALAGVVLYEADAVSGGAVEITEPFTYSNGRLSTVSSAAWDDESASMAVSSNTVVWSASNSDEIAAHNTQLSTATHYAQVKITLANTSEYSGGGVIVRSDGSVGGTADGYRVEIGHWSAASNIGFNRIDNGTTTEVSTTNIGATSTAQRTLKVEANGNTLTAYVNGASVASYGSASSYTTNRYTGIYAGKYSNGGNVTLDDFEAGTLGGTDGTATPAAVAVAVTVPAVTPVAGSAVAPAAIAVPVTIPAATGQASHTATPAAHAVPMTVPAATTTAGSTPTPAAIAVPVTLPAATPQAGATTAPDAVAIPITVPQVSTGSAATAEPDTIAIPVTVPAATPLASSTTIPDAIAVPVTVPAATPSASSTVTPAAITVPVTVPAVTTAAGAVVAPDAIAVTVAVETASATGSDAGTATPAAIAVTATIPQATPAAGTTVAPGVITVPITLPAATAQASHTATPDTIAVTVTLDAVTTQGGAAGSPATITVPFTLPAVTTAAGAAASPDVIDVVVTVHQVTVGDPEAVPTHAVTIEIRDRNHTATIDDTRLHTASIRDRGHTATVREL